MRHFAPLCALLLGACMTSHSASTTSTAPNASVSAASPASDDPYIWLEDIEGDRAMQWVKAQNATSLGTLGAIRATRTCMATRCASSGDGPHRDARHPRAHVDNFWQDPTHVRGDLRRTTPASYRSANPEWRDRARRRHTLGTAEGKNWVCTGRNCLPSRRPALSRRAVERRQGCGRDSRVRRRDEAVRRRRLPPPRVEGERRRGSTRTRCWSGATSGPARSRSRDIPSCEAARARQAARSGGGGVPRLARPRLGQRVSCCATPTAGCRRCSRAAASPSTRARSGCCATTAPPCSSPSRSATASAVSSTASSCSPSRWTWNGFETGDLLAYDLAALKRDPATAKPTLILRPGARESIEGVTVHAQHARGEPEREREGRGVRLPARRDRLDAHAARASRERDDRPRLRVAHERRAVRHGLELSSCPTACGSPTPHRGRSRR